MTPDYINTLLKLTRVTAPDVVAATIEHLCDGATQASAADKHGVKQEAVARMAKRLRELDGIVSEAIERKSKNNS